MATGLTINLFYDVPGSGCTMTSTVASGGIASIVITNPGSGYDSPPALKITRNAADTITRAATLAPLINMNGNVIGCNILDGGAGYAHSPTITPIAPGSASPSTFICSTDTLAAMERYRVTNISPVAGSTDQNGVSLLAPIPMWPDVVSMIVALLNVVVLQPALSVDSAAFDDTDMAVKRLAVANAQATLQALLDGLLA